MTFLLVLSSVVVSITVILGVIFKNKRMVERVSSPVKVGKGIIGFNLASLFTIITVAIISLIPDGHAFAAQTAAATATIAKHITGLPYVGAALSTGLAAIGAGIAVGLTGAAAIGAISEKPEMLGRTLLFVGLAEGIAIYGLIISIMILARV